jgi:1-acyl-sn-glycerol-3-phosphate acyltransferase
MHSFLCQLIALWRLLRVLGCVARGVWIQWVHFPHWSDSQKQLAVVNWSGRMLDAMNVKVNRTGDVASGPLLMVCNHISWLDILVCHSQFFGRFVAKGEVHSWPVLGGMAQQAGTLFIERSSRRDALRVVHDMASALSSGDTVMIFPEGTTNNGLELLPFHANLIQAAIVSESPIQPMGLSYWSSGHPRQRSLAPRFFGDDTLMASLWSTLSSGGVVAELALGKVQHAEGRDRRQWASDLRNEVLELIGS